MRNVVLYIAMSLDGYIADKDGSVGWLAGDGSDPENMGTYPEFYDSIDTIIIGYNTYNQIVTELSPDNWVYEGKQCYVITNRSIESTDGITFTNEKVEDLVVSLKQESGSDIWICGGASIAQQLIQADLIDIFRISIIPATLGDGIPLFYNTSKAFKLISTVSNNGITELCYHRR